MSQSANNADPSPTDIWFVATHAGTLEYRLEALLGAIEQGAVERQTLVWREGMSAWVELAQEPLLSLLAFGHPTEAPPLPLPATIAPPAVESGTALDDKFDEQTPARASNFQLRATRDTPTRFESNAILDESPEDKTVVASAEYSRLLATGVAASSPSADASVVSSDDKTVIASAEYSRMLVGGVAATRQSTVASDKSHGHRARVEPSEEGAIVAQPPPIVPRPTALPMAPRADNASPKWALLGIAELPRRTQTPSMSQSPGTRIAGPKTPRSGSFDVSLPQLAAQPLAETLTTTVIAEVPPRQATVGQAPVATVGKPVKPRQRSDTGDAARDDSRLTGTAPFNPSLVESARPIPNDESPAKNVRAKPPPPVRRESVAPPVPVRTAPPPVRRASVAPPVPVRTAPPPVRRASVAPPVAPAPVHPSPPATAQGPERNVKMAEVEHPFGRSEIKLDTPLRQSATAAFVATTAPAHSADLQVTSDRHAVVTADEPPNSLSPSSSAIHDFEHELHRSKRKVLFVAGAIGFFATVAIAANLASSQDERVAVPATQEHTSSKQAPLPGLPTSAGSSTDTHEPPDIAPTSAVPRGPEVSTNRSDVPESPRAAARKTARRARGRARRSHSVDNADVGKSSGGNARQRSERVDSAAALDEGVAESRDWMNPGF